jgi:PPOX class probable F420-dependent enzyme
MTGQIPQSAVDLIESGAHAHLTTINADGSPQTSVVWVAHEDGELHVASLTMRQKLRNVRRDPRVGVSWLSSERDRLRLPYYLVIRGHATVTEGGAPELLRRIAPRFIGPDIPFPRGDDPPEGYVLRIRPEHIGGYGPWADNA